MGTSSPIAKWNDSCVADATPRKTFPPIKTLMDFAVAHMMLPMTASTPPLMKM
jgi:hypothetical protein